MPPASSRPWYVPPFASLVSEFGVGWEGKGRVGGMCRGGGPLRTALPGHAHPLGCHVGPCVDPTPPITGHANMGRRRHYLQQRHRACGKRAPLIDRSLIERAGVLIDTEASACQRTHDHINTRTNRRIGGSPARRLSALTCWSGRRPSSSALPSRSALLHASMTGPRDGRMKGHPPRSDTQSRTPPPTQHTTSTAASPTGTSGCPRAPWWTSTTS